MPWISNIIYNLALVSSDHLPSFLTLEIGQISTKDICCLINLLSGLYYPCYYLHGCVFKGYWSEPFFFQEFNKKSNSLYTILRSSRLAGSQRAPFLRRFLLRMNFNSFFEVGISAVLHILKNLAPVPLLFVSMNRQLQGVCWMLLDHVHLFLC